MIVAIQKNEFKWVYISDIFKSDVLKLATFAIVVGVGRYSGVTEFNDGVVQGGAGIILATGLVSGIIRNLVYMFPGLEDVVPQSLQEPAEMRMAKHYID